MLKISAHERYHSATDVMKALQLEPDWDNLRTCMTDVSAGLHAKPEPEILLEGYTPPLMRQAQAIRERRAKFQARRARSDRAHLTLYSSSGF
jgi:hypothetical protein